MPTVSCPADADSMMTDQAASTNYGSQSLLYAGRVPPFKSGSTSTYRSVFRFDLSSLPVAGLAVAAATVRLYGVNPIMGDGSCDVECKQITASWTEAGITWNNQPSFSAVQMSHLSTDYADGDLLDFPITPSLVQDWKNSVQPNYGVILKKVTETGSTTQEYASRESTDPTQRPVLIVTYTGNSAPNPPPLISPASGVGLDLAAGGTFQATFSDNDVGDTCTAYAFRRHIGAGAYEYWDATGLTWSGSIVWNTIAPVAIGATVSVVFPAGKWTNGNTYGWGMAMKDNTGDAGSFSADFTVVAEAAPVVTVIAPSGFVNDTSFPQTIWTSTGTTIQNAFKVKIFESAVYGAGGFNPDTSIPDWDSGIQLGDKESIISLAALANGHTYKSYVMIRRGVSWSAWAAGPAFTMLLDQPAAPNLVTTPDPTLARVRLQSTGVINVLDKDSSDFELSTGLWIGELNARNFQDSATSPIQGSRSLITEVGSSYDTLEARYATIDLLDAAFGTYDLMDAALF